MYPPMWGKYYWAVIHVITMQHDNGLNENAKEMLTLLIKNLPCPGCSRHAQDYFLKYPFPSQKTATEWGIRFHNEVNERTGKPKLSVEKAKLAIRELLLSYQQDKNIQIDSGTDKVQPLRHSPALFIGVLVVPLLLVGGYLVYIRKHLRSLKHPEKQSSI